MARELGRKDGLLVGVSAAGAVATSLQIAEREAGKPDGESLSSSPFFATPPNKYISETLLAGRLDQRMLKS